MDRKLVVLAGALVGCLCGCEEKVGVQATPSPAVANQGAPNSLQVATRPAGPKPRQISNNELRDVDKSRDPFEPPRAGTPPPPPPDDQMIAKADKYALDELKLVAIVGGKARATAMFRAAFGRGFMVKRGERLSKTKNRVQQILPDRVIFEVAPNAPDAKKGQRVLILDQRKVATGENTFKLSNGS